ncbi:MAG: response regulator [Syntrophales bacterium]
MIDAILDIILVDDSPYDIELTLHALKEHNLANRVKVLRDGEEAINYIFRQGKYRDCVICENPSLILLDMMLPKIDGLEILRRIRGNERTKTIPVVLLTSEDMSRTESYKLGIASYIIKPIDFDEFSKTISQIGLYWTELNGPR